MGGVRNPPVPGVLKKTINIFDFLTAAEQADVLARTGLIDLNSKITSWIAAVGTNGARLYAPAGRYFDATGGHTIANPCLILGDGIMDMNIGLAASTGLTQFECGSASAKMFTITSLLVKIQDLAVTSSQVPVSGNSAFFVNGATEQQKVDLENVQTSGFYDAADYAVGSTVSLNKCVFANFTHWGARIRNIINADAGDGKISDCWFYPANAADACIRYESSGGLTINNVKCVPNSAGWTFSKGLSFAMTGASGQLSVNNFNVDGSADECIIGDGTNWLGFFIGNSILRTMSATAAGINLNACSRVAIGNNIIVGNGGAAAMIITNTAGLVINPQRVTGFTADLSQSGNTLALNTSDIDHKFLGQMYDSAGSAVASALSHFTGIFKSFYAIGNNHLLYGLSGQVAADGIIGNDASVDRWYLGSSTNDASLTGTSAFWDANNNFGGGSAALTTSSTSGFTYMPAVAGAPTGAPTAITGYAAFRYDTTNHKFWVYDTAAAAWRGVVVT